MIRRGIGAALLAVLLFWCCPVLPVSGAEVPDPPALTHAKAGCLYNFENDVVLYEENVNERVFPAATVKMMTAIVAFETFGDDLDRQITVTRQMLEQVVGNRIGFEEGEIVTARQMLSCMLVNSANDAAIILAYAAAGSIEAFVSMMNDKALEIGTYSTYYTNPTGMHDSAMVTTARDTLLIAKYAYAVPGLVDMTTLPKYVMEATNMHDYRNVYNRNGMISKYYGAGYLDDRVFGLSAGATAQAGYVACELATDTEVGLTYVAVILGAEDDDEESWHYVNAENLLDWAFENYGYVEVLSHRKIITELPVSLSSTLDYVTLVPKEDIVRYLPLSVDPETDIRYSYQTREKTLTAPIESGMEVGTVTVTMDDQIIGSAPLITTTSIARSEFLYFLSRVEEFIKSRLFIGTLVSAAVITVIYVLIKARRREKKLRRMTRHR